MKKITKLLLPSIVIMLIAIVSLTGATYAWFQGSNTATIDGISADVVAADGMLVSWDGKTWKSNLSFDDTEYLKFDVTENNPGKDSGNTNWKETGWKFEPLSTARETYADGALEMRTAVVVDGKIASISKPITEGFVKFDIYINLTKDTNVWVYNLNVNGAENENTIGLASRVAFIYQGNEETYNTDAIRALKAPSATDANFYIYEPNATVHTEDGKNFQSAYVKTDTTNDVYQYMGLVQDYAGDTALEIGVSDAYKKSVTTVTSLGEGAGADKASTLTFAMKAGYNKLTVYLWIEGQDADCLNNLAGTNLSVDFSIAKENTEQTA